MKTIKLLFVIIIMAAIGATVSAQAHDHQKMASAKTETIKVWGNCDMCKSRIEKAVKSEGATSADWSTKTKILTVTFDPSKTSIDTFSKKLASVGHDTEKYKANDEAYNALDACCKYERKK